MLSTHLWAIARPDYQPYLKAARLARAAVMAAAWRSLRRGVARLLRPRRRAATATVRS